MNVPLPGLGDFFSMMVKIYFSLAKSPEIRLPQLFSLNFAHPTCIGGEYVGQILCIFQGAVVYFFWVFISWNVFLDTSNAAFVFLSNLICLKGENIQAAVYSRKCQECSTSCLQRMFQKSEVTHFLF